MAILNIDGHKIYDLFIAGAHNLIHWENNLNSINVFPVADGDTGTNLAMTMKTIINNSVMHSSVHESLNSISEVAIENSYGNSGIIFASFLNGFATETKNKKHITNLEFTDVAIKAAIHAYDAVMHPKEGTILSVMKGWAAVLHNKMRVSDFETSFYESVHEAKHLVEATKEQLKVLKKNDVVDAGAKGFLIFLEGINNFLKYGKHGNINQEEIIEFEKHINILNEQVVIKNRYCSQFYLKSDSHINNIKHTLDDLGDSIIVTQKDNHYKVHIHTNYPERVMENFLQLGEIISHHVDDMVLERDIIHNRKYKIAIVTDSIADIPQRYISEHQINVIPINLICDSVVYTDKITMTPEFFYKNLNSYKMNPTSAQPFSSVYEDTFRLLLKHYDSVIGIFVSNQMSGTYVNAKRMAKKLDNSGEKIAIIDSKQNSAAEGLLVMKAIELLQQDYSHKKIVGILNSIRDDIHIYVSLQDLTNMIKGGRISKTKGFILKILRLKPVISIDRKGKGIVYKKTLTEKAAAKQIFKKIKKDFNERGIEKYCIVYSDDKDKIFGFKNKLAEIIGKPPVYIDAISPVVGLNAGIGSFAVAYIKGGKQ